MGSMADALVVDMENGFIGQSLLPMKRLRAITGRSRFTFFIMVLLPGSMKAGLVFGDRWRRATLLGARLRGFPLFPSENGLTDSRRLCRSISNITIGRDAE